MGRGRRDVRWLRSNAQEMTHNSWASHERQSLTMVLDGGLIPDRTASGERIADDTLAVLLHSSDEDRDWRLPPGRWEVVLDTAAPDEKPGTRVLGRGRSLTVAARSVVVLRLVAPRR